MKTIIFGLLILTSLSSFARSQDDLCNGYYMDAEVTVKTCIAKIFITDHQNTYYGSEVYFAKSLDVNKKQLQEFLGKAKYDFNADETTRTIPSYYVIDNYKEIISSHSYFAIVIEEHDLPRYHVYAVNPNAENNKKALQKVAQFYADGIDYSENDELNISEKTFGFSSKDLFLRATE